MARGESSWHEDQHVPIERDGRLDDAWWTYGYSPVPDADGTIAGTLVVCQEVTARILARREQERLLTETARAERRAARVLERMSDEHLTMDADFRILTVNDAALRALGMRREDLIGRTHAEAFPASIGSVAEAQYQRVAREGAEVRFTHHYVGEGYDRHLEIEAYPTDERGVAVFWRDVSERLRAEAALRAGATRYHSLFESLDEGFCLIELLFDEAGQPVDYRFIETNSAFERQSGLVGAVGHTARELVPTLEAHWIEAYGRVATTGESIRFANGSEEMGRWFDVFASRVGAPADRHVALLFTDVSHAHAAEREREQLLAALELERSRLAYVFDQAPAFLAVLRGPEHVFTLVNDAYYQLVGHRPVVGLGVWDALPEVRGQGFEALLDDVLATGTPFVGREVPIAVARTPGAPPEQRYIDLTYMPLVEGEGERVGIIAHGTDVTGQVLARRDVERLLGESERARAEAEAARVEAEAARADAETANRSKSEFLAVMSHELRTPLNAIGGYTELMEMGIRGPVTQAQLDDLRRIQTSQRHLLGLINEVLNYAKLETGTVHYDVQDVRMRDVLAASESLVAPQARAKGLVLEVVECDPAIVARADLEKLRQVLVNLLSNAVKFTDGPGRLTLACLVRGARVEVRLEDTGMGIPADKLEAIFEPFVQVRADLTRTAEGTGLGLAISRDLARGMGGDLLAESTLGTGSTFTLVLPRACAP